MPKQQGFNRNLPDPKLKEDKSWNKLTYYEQADKDSAKYKEQLKNDPYFKGMTMGSHPPSASKLENTHLPDYDPSPVSSSNYKDPNEEKVNHKLAELNAALNKPVTTRPVSPAEYPIVSTNNSLQHNDVDRLENMLQAISQKDTSTDPEMQQLGGMMDKILDIQHPERVTNRIQEQSQQHKQEVYPVTINNNVNTISLLQSMQVRQVENDRKKVKDTGIEKKEYNDFYSLNDDISSAESQNAIPATIEETQTLVSGSAVKLRLLNDIFINGVLMPKENFVFGIASLNTERLQINITSIRYQNNILPVSLSVYDLDGIVGLFIPGAIGRDVAKQSADQATQSIGLTTLDPSIGAQAASAGIQAAKTLVSKKVKMVKVTVKAGYQVLLRDNNKK